MMLGKEKRKSVPSLAVALFFLSSSLGMSDLSRPGGRNAALLIVDAQNEYIEENGDLVHTSDSPSSFRLLIFGFFSCLGPLSVPGAKEIIPVINQLCSKVHLP